MRCSNRPQFAASNAASATQLRRKMDRGSQIQNTRRTISKAVMPSPKTQSSTITSRHTARWLPPPALCCSTSSAITY